MTVENTELAPTMEDRAGDTEETAEEALELLDDRTNKDLLDEATKGKTDCDNFTAAFSGTFERNPLEPKPKNCSSLLG